MKKYRIELLIAAAVLLAAAALFLLYGTQGSGTAAEIAVDGRVIQTVTLSAADDYRIDLRESHGLPVAFEAKGGSIRFVDVDCPDHICENTGWLSEYNRIAVCMPNRVTLTLR